MGLATQKNDFNIEIVSPTLLHCIAFFILCSSNSAIFAGFFSIAFLSRNLMSDDSQHHSHQYSASPIS